MNVGRQGRWIVSLYLDLFTDHVLSAAWSWCNYIKPPPPPPPSSPPLLKGGVLTPAFFSRRTHSIRKMAASRRRSFVNNSGVWRGKAPCSLKWKGAMSSVSIYNYYDSRTKARQGGWRAQKASLLGLCLSTSRKLKVMIELPIGVVSYQKNCASRGSARLLYATITTHCTYNYSDHGTRVVTCTSEEPQARHREGSLDNMASGLQRRTHKQPIVALLWRYLIVALLWRRGVVAVPLHAKGSVMYWRCINAPCYSRCIIILVWSLDFSMYACIILQQRSKNGNNTGEL